MCIEFTRIGKHRVHYCDNGDLILETTGKHPQEIINIKIEKKELHKIIDLMPNHIFYGEFGGKYEQ